MLRLGLALAALALLAPPGPAHAIDPLARISGAGVVPRACEARSAQRGSEVEPTITADPSAPGGLVAAWQQDRYRVGGGAAALGVAFSRDGGSTWAPASVPGLTGCIGATARVSDPWVSAGPDGTIYLTAIAGSLRARNGLRTAVVAASSRDGGATWSQPAVLAPAIGPFNDKPSITADPARPRRAYVVWSQLDRILLARTDDGGASWTAPRPIAHGQQLNVSTLSVLPDGALLHAWFRAGRGHEQLASSRSIDEGATWSAPVAAGDVDEVTPRDPSSGISLRSTALAAPAAIGAPGGGAYAAWTTRGRSGRPQVVLARSADGGATWGHARPITPGTQARFTAAIAVTPAGTLGVTTYRLLRGGRADVLAQISLDGGLTFSARPLTPPFALRGAPRTLGDQRFLGDYSGLTAAPGGFAAAVAVSAPLAISGPSEVLLGRIAAP